MRRFILSMVHDLAMLAIAGFAVLAPQAWAMSSEHPLAQLQHTVWNAREGVPLGIQAMAQTEDGYLWLGTVSGLYRFDGVRFTRHLGQSGDALPQDTVRAIQALPGNGLMVGWQLGGVSLVRQGHVVHTPPGKDFPPGTVRQLALAPDGSVWAAVRGGAARYADGRWELIGPEWGFESKTARAIFVDRDGSLAIRTDEGQQMLAPGARRFHLVPSNKLISGGVGITQARDGTLYYSDEVGIRAVPSLALRERPGPPFIWKTVDPKAGYTGFAFIDSGGGMWISTVDRGIDRLRFPSRLPGAGPGLAPEHFGTRDGLSLGYCTAFLEDRDGSVWIATVEGLNRFRETRFAEAHAGNEPAIAAAEDGAVLVTQYPHRAIRIDKAGASTPFPPADDFGAAYRTAAGDTLFGFTAFGNRSWPLARLSRGRMEGIAPPPDAPPTVEVQSLTQDAQGGVWASFIGFGIGRWAGGQWTQPVPGAPALFVHATADGSVWLGYVKNRLLRWRADGTQEFSAEQGLHVGNVRALQSDGARLWIGGDEGLCVHDGARIRCLATRERDPLRGIRGIVVTPQGDLWLSGTQGAVWLAAEDVRRALQAADGIVAYRFFDAQDGILGSAPALRPVPSIVQGTDGRIWVATSRGVYVAAPERLSLNRRPPSVVIESLQADAARFEWPKEAQVAPRVGQLRIEYTALALSIPQRTQFRYRLEGVDADWRDAGSRREATYTQLKPGQYRFHVTAANEDGVWNDSGAQLDFTVEPAFVETTLFKTLCALLVALALGLLYRVRVRFIRRQFQARFQERLIERERIARELHDTLLQSVQGLILRCQAVMVRMAKADPARGMLEAALVQADEVLNEGRERIHDLRLADTGQDAFENGLREAGAELAQPNGVRFDMVVQGPCRRIHPLVAEEALRIAREAISNAVRHAGTPRIEVEVIYGPDSLRLHIRDEGKGIDPAIVEAGGVAGHWGLSGMQERARLMGAKLHVWSRKEAGTEVELRVPATAAYVANAGSEATVP